MKFLSNDYANPNTNPKILSALILTLTDPNAAFGSFCGPVFCDFIRNYFLDSESECRTSKHKKHKKCGVWWFIGNFVAFRPKGRGFEVILSPSKASTVA